MAKKQTTADDTVTIEFTKSAQLRGRGYFRGNRIEVDAATAEAYCRADQAVLVSELDAANDDVDEGEPDNAAPASRRRTKK